MTVAEIYESRKNDPRWNTSYPLSPMDWAKYRVAGPLSFDQEKCLSFYVHIPFCKQLCSFCEYTRMLCPDERSQNRYIRSIVSDIKNFLQQYPDIVLQGFDIGGGTPTALSDDNFSLLMNEYKNVLSGLELTDDFEPSIEASFDTLSENKIKAIANSSIRRLSLGVQSSCDVVLNKVNRNGIVENQMQEWLSLAWRYGINKVNLDFMYGLKGQNNATIENDLALIEKLKPQQVTLYELRTNMIADKDLPLKQTLFEHYSQYYSGLLSMGYQASFGQNSFSVNASDMGVSSYIRHRMKEGAPYKGFGISAQSMNRKGLSYNVGKNSFNNTLLNRYSFEEEFTYQLPVGEIVAKYIAIAAYSGVFSISVLSSLLNEDARQTYSDQLGFCLSNGLLRQKGDLIQITEKGFEYYGAVFSLFYMPIK